MTELKLKGRYNLKKNKKFFNDKEPREYHGFLIFNPEIIPTEYLYVRVLIGENLIKRFRLDFEANKDYQFIVNLGDKKTAKFTNRNRNEMVLNSANYFENTIKKIGALGSGNYFYEQKRNNENNNNDNSPQDGNKNNLTKIFLFALPIILFVLFFFLIIKWVSKRKIIKYK